MSTLLNCVEITILLMTYKYIMIFISTYVLLELLEIKRIIN